MKNLQYVPANIPGKARARRVLVLNYFMIPYPEAPAEKVHQQAPSEKDDCSFAVRGIQRIGVGLLQVQMKRSDALHVKGP